VLKGVTAHIPIYADATYLFILSIDRERHRHRDRHAVLRARRRRRAQRRQPGQSEACRGKPSRHPLAADLQSGRRLRQLCRTGGLHTDPAAAAAHRVRVADECGSDAGLQWSVGAGARPRHGAPDDFAACTCALCLCAALCVWILRARSPSAAHRTRLGICSRNQLPGPDGRRLVQASGDADPHFSGHQPTAVLPRRAFLAARGHPRAGYRPRATSFRPIWRSTVLFASIRWARASGRSRAIGAGSGVSRSSISGWR
jgi:hypothetical protein